MADPATLAKESLLEFEARGAGIYQTLASRRGFETKLPLTRQDLYPR